MKGQATAIRKVLAGFLSGGHVLLEDYPGTGKTTLAKALSMFDGSEFVTPEHIQEIAVPVIAHRLVMDPQARFSGQTAKGVVDAILKTVPVPT